MVGSLGIDASLRSSGVVHICNGSVEVINIRPKKLSGSKRLQYIGEQFKEFTSSIQGPVIGVMEGPSFFSTNRQFAMGEVYGLFKYLALCDLGVDLITPSPKELKKYLASSGDASKEKMIDCALKLGCPSNQEDICDAYAAALLGIDISNGSNAPGTRKSLEVIRKYSSTK